jgi:glycosyltransferase involved in cell wall biosynthesis
MAPGRAVLLISYHFPPSPAVGGVRIANFARYLSEFGWDPVVLTIADEDLRERDDARLENLSHVTIVKARSWPTLSEAYLAAKRRWTRDERATVAASPVSPPREPQPAHALRPLAAAGAPPESFIAGCRRYFLSLLTVPDGHRGWIVPAAARAIREVRRRQVACIVTSCPPYSAHLVGLIVRVVTGVRWIADFRDPWMSGGAKSLYITSSLSLRIDRWLERQVVERANVVLANTPKLGASFRKAYPHLGGGKFVTLTNSIDLARFVALWELPKESVFTIAYAGSLYFNRSPEPVFIAVRRLLDEGVLTAAGVRIRLVGQCDRVGQVSTRDLARRHGVEDVVEIGAPMPYDDALRLIRRSHVALLLAPTQPNQIPAKAYDYIGVGTEILAIAGPGATADLVTQSGTGSVYEEHDIEGIEGFLRRMASRPLAVQGEMPSGARAFDARAQTGRLAVLLENRTVEAVS